MWIEGLEGLYSVTSDGLVYSHRYNRYKRPYNNRIVIKGKCYYISKKLRQTQENNISLFDLLEDN